MTALETPELESRCGGLPGETCITVLETQRLMLRAPRLEDARAVAALADDRRIAEMTSNLPHPYAVKDAENWINAQGQTGDTAFLIFTKADGAFIGATGYVLAEATDPEIGYWLGLPFWGQGYATEAARAVVDHVFTSTEAPAITVRARVMNDRSRRVIEKCGFQWIGAGLTRIKTVQGSVPVDVFRLDRGTWMSFKAWRDPVTRRQAPIKVVG